MFSLQVSQVLEKERSKFTNSSQSGKCTSCKSVSEQWSLTFGDRKISNRLPSVHSHPPSTLNATATEVNDKLAGVAIESGKYGLQAIERERA